MEYNQSISKFGRCESLNYKINTRFNQILCAMNVETLIPKCMNITPNLFIMNKQYLD